MRPSTTSAPPKRVLITGDTPLPQILHRRGRTPAPISSALRGERPELTISTREEVLADTPKVTFARHPQIQGTAASLASEARGAITTQPSFISRVQSRVRSGIRSIETWGVWPSTVVPGRAAEVQAAVDIERAARVVDGKMDTRSTSLGAALTEMRKLRRVRQMLRPARLVAALFGSVSLVAPMLIMAIHPSQTKSIVTSCCFILAFSVLVALVATGSPAEVLCGASCGTHETEIYQTLPKPRTSQLMPIYYRRLVKIRPRLADRRHRLPCASCVSSRNQIKFPHMELEGSESVFSSTRGGGGVA